MKTLLLILLLSCNTAWSQFKIAEIPSKRFSLAAYSNMYIYNFYSGVEGGIQLKKHWMNAAIAVDPTNWSSKFSQSWALNLNYNYLPNSYSNRFDLYFDINYSLGVNNWKLNYVNQQGETKIDKFYSATNDICFGFGFNTNFSQKIFLKTGFGLGIKNEFGFFDNLDFSANFRLSLGYRF